MWWLITFDRAGGRNGTRGGRSMVGILHSNFPDKIKRRALGELINCLLCSSEGGC